MLTKIQSIDYRFIDWIQTHLRHPIMDALMRFMSLIGNCGAIWVLAALALLLSGTGRHAAFCVMCALAANVVLVNLFLKRVARRPRPFTTRGDRDPLILPPTDFSFPSGHTFSSFAASTVIYMFFPQMGIAALAIAFLISFSRLYLYVHFVTDVLISTVLGVGTGYLVCRIYFGIFLDVVAESASLL